MYIVDKFLVLISYICSFYYFEDSDDDVKYSKIVSATTNDLLHMLENERRQLVALLEKDDTQVTSFTADSILHLPNGFSLLYATCCFSHWRHRSFKQH